MKPRDLQQFRLTNKRQRFPKWLRVTLVTLGVLFGVFILANLVMHLLYRNKVMPNYSVAAVPIGGIPFDKLDDQVSVGELLPREVIFTKDDITKKVTPKDLGVTVDWTATQKHIRDAKIWLPLWSLVSKHTVPAELKLDNTHFATAAKGLEAAFTKIPLPERIVFRDDNFVIAAPESGYSLNTVQLRRDLIMLLEQGKTDLAAPTIVTNSTEPVGKLGGERDALNRKLGAKITFTAGNSTKQLSRADIARFFEPSGQTLKLSDAKIAEVVVATGQGLGVTPVNRSEAVQASHYALNKQLPVNFALVNQGKQVYAYCVAAKDLPSSVLSEFRQKLAAVYGDPRGWNKGGEFAIAYDEDSCDFTVWLSAAASVPSFGPDICDNYYSCRVGRNVVINYDRWKGATDPWNAAGGALEDYRVMVINHETGHWFGFNHRNCPGPGQPAPVMQQQSIDLQGCKFNTWPTPAELAAL